MTANKAANIHTDLLTASPGNRSPALRSVHSKHHIYFIYELTVRDVFNVVIRVRGASTYPAIPSRAHKR